MNPGLLRQATVGEQVGEKSGPIAGYYYGTLPCGGGNRGDNDFLAHIAAGLMEDTEGDGVSLVRAEALDQLDS